LTYSKTAGPAEAVVTAAGLLTYTAVNGTVAGRDEVITVQVTDGMDPVTSTVTYKVVLPAAPAWAVAGEMIDQKVMAGATVTQTYAATDPNAQAVTYSIVSGPGTVDAVTGVYSWVTTIADGGVNTVTVKATDSGGLSVQTTAIVTVQLYGDANVSGAISGLDASVVLQHAAALVLLTGDGLILADVTGNSTVSALDASYILQYDAELITYAGFPVVATAKPVAAAGDVKWMQPIATENESVMNLPVVLEQASNVYSVNFYANIDPTVVDVQGVAVDLPEGWQMVYNFADGRLSIAMAGVTPLESGALANVSLKILSEVASANLTGEAFVNENRTQALEQLSIRQIPSEFALEQNYPNPFNPTTNIRFQLADEANVSVIVYNILGNKVRNLVQNERKQAGYYTVEWDGMNDAGQLLPSGTYLYHITAGSFSATKKMLLIK